MSEEKSVRMSLFGIALILLLAFSPLVNAQQNTVSATILTEWVDDGNGNLTHGYRIILSESLTFSELEEISVTIEHVDAEGDLVDNWALDWTGGNNTELALVINSTLNWKDSITLEVFQTGCCSPSTLIGSRTIQVTIWNEPLSDHEITRVTNWDMLHSSNELSDSQSWDLSFIGQGWQQRTGDVLESNELGSGTLGIEESTEGGDGEIALFLWLDTVWLNETILGMNLQSQTFEMRGNGTISVNTSEDGIITEIDGDVVNSYIIRSLNQGIVEEQLRIEANGGLSINGDGGGESIEANGTLALLLIETHDLDGERLLSNTEFEGTADMSLSGDDYQMDLDINQIISRERWENGQLHSSLNRIQGDGAFDFAEQDENGSSMTVNATVYDFFQETVNGEKTGDRIHVDGTFTGDVNGDFGTVRDIVATNHTQANSTGDEFNVNVIFTETWLNLSGIGNNPFDMEAIHNKTWEYEAPQEHWDNRTVRLRWNSMEGGEPSEGDEFPERSPIQNNLTPPEVESVVGDLDITRETGISPSELMVGDRLDLLSSEIMHLSVTATQTGIVNRDGHTIPVTHWTGTYGNEGSAFGAVINEGVLAGLITEVSRNVSLDLGDGESAVFEETQSLSRVLSPSIITESENTPPSVVSVSIREGNLLNENGNIAHLEVTISDPDWNVRSVEADFSVGDLDLGTIVLNDIGLDGDISIHDEKFTAMIEYSGTFSGDADVQINVEDDWVTVDIVSTIFVQNRLPRVTSLDFSPQSVNRGDLTTVTISAEDSSGVSSVGVDTTEWGGNITLLDLVDGVWIGEIVVPMNIPSGNQILPVRVQDGDGGNGITTVYGNGEQLQALYILNEGPAVSNLTFYDEGTITTELDIPSSGTNYYTMTATVTDLDPITIVQAKLGVLAPPGESENWVSMRDDGQGVDAIANDGIWSVEVEVRPWVPSTAVVEVRGIDQQLAQTPISDRSFTVDLGTSSGGENGGGQAVLEGASQTWLILGVIGLFLVAAIVGLTLWIRSGGLRDMISTPEDPWN
ncbi:MAG: choice-of-anchor X domain-containing protein [Candidatus Thermoplasmatota archaeon]|nr:choice-of-anchor X domain-containing protein [Candidatus Thermoplasmatota archaeon]